MRPRAHAWVCAWLVPGLLAATGTCTIEPAHAQQVPCEQLLPQDNELAYRLRNDRCEGLFIQDTSSSVRLKALHLASSGPTAGTGMLRASLPMNAPAGRYRVRIQSFDPRIHYQLDAAISPAGSFAWPAAEVVDRVPLQHSDLALLGWTTLPSLLYVPVRLGDKAFDPAKAVPTRVRAVFETTVPVERYVARLTDETGSTSIELNASSTLPATSLVFDIPAKLAQGRYTFWLRVRLMGEAAPEQQNWPLWLP